MGNGATLDPGEDLTRMNRFVGGQPPGDGGGPGGGTVNGQDPLDGALDQIGAMLTARAQKRFREQRFGDFPWRARKVPNIAGILSDLQAGKNPPQRRWDDRPALQDTGRLKASITWRTGGRGSVEVGSNLEYAGKAQWGGTSVFSITGKVKDGLQKLIDRGKDPTGELAGLMNETEYSVTTPERIYVGIDEQDAKDIGRIIDRWFGGKPYEIEIR